MEGLSKKAGHHFDLRGKRRWIWTSTRAGKASYVEELGKEWRKLVKYNVRTIDELEDRI